MTETEIYTDLKEKTKDLKIPKRTYVYNIADLCKMLSYLQVTDMTLKGVDYEHHEEQFAILFGDYYPKNILKNGQYLAQLNRVLDFFKPGNPSPYKKLTQAVFLTARYFDHYASFDDFRKEVVEACKDEDSTLDYLNRFRYTSKLSSIYFVKTCLFFEHAGLLDIPLVTKKAKDYLLPLFDMEDENDKLYRKMNHLAKANGIICYELNRRIEALS